MEIEPVVEEKVYQDFWLRPVFEMICDLQTFLQEIRLLTQSKNFEAIEYLLIKILLELDKGMRLHSDKRR